MKRVLLCALCVKGSQAQTHKLSRNPFLKPELRCFNKPQKANFQHNTGAGWSERSPFNKKFECKLSLHHNACNQRKGFKMGFLCPGEKRFASFCGASCFQCRRKSWGFFSRCCSMTITQKICPLVKSRVTQFLSSIKPALFAFVKLKWFNYQRSSRSFLAAIFT